SRIAGDIFPFDEALDLDFTADSVPVGFLKPFMIAFARDISGRASGHCRLFGTFKEIDLTGDVYGDNIRMAVDFTNTVYSTSDSVHMRPGRIIIPEATMYDAEGHTAKISGWVGHTFFKAPTFRFDVTQANNFLSFNGTPAQNPDWYGTIYGNGTASVYGEPGVVNIEADMTTAPRSSFTFVLSDRLDAVDYSFITFRDVTPDSLRTAVAVPDEVPLIVRQLQNRLNQANADEPSAYRMKISVDITPDAALTLVMDPATDDAIKATGTGHVTMSYNSTDEDLRIYGAYNVASGSYHFTLQDIIIKDFTIKEGSTINFDGDPYAVRADLKAYYATTANLSDLDKSFLQDRDVARTKVPVHALMNVRGDIRQPDITFDLEFPTLTSDTYRKVRSIVSTNDMMNRQIIYLLALNRFYTPDYMNSTTKGSELFSVASSTISSQLSSLLGKISDNWSIAPNLRSDRGDFSDLEVDVALSSQLLNNRLLFNGNFGYRDKSLNSNQFVGDFDIEYLLNRRGTWRLKAYNRYNDANYYLRSAATTQGVGIMYRRDFDNLFSFLRPKKKARPVTALPDSTATEQPRPTQP
ncbi:MAG: translocation/assembly module TamB, partial [Muribaculaceae bacterium]|nr:translocation/assembly module TamB [Muribaculaceae bacterium]